MISFARGNVLASTVYHLGMSTNAKRYIVVFQ